MPQGALPHGEDLLINMLKDMYYAEKQILKALPKMAKQAESAARLRAPS